MASTIDIDNIKPIIKNIETNVVMNMKILIIFTHVIHHFR